MPSDTDNLSTFKKVLTDIKNNPISMTLKAQLRPAFTFNENNIKDVTLQLAMQFCLMENAWAVQALLDSEDPVKDLFNFFKHIADEPVENPETQKTRREKAAAKEKKAAKEAELKKLKKHIHAFARLMNHDPKLEGARQIVNLKKLFIRLQNNKAKANKDNAELTALIAADEAALKPFMEDEKPKQKYAVLSGITPVTDENTDTKSTISRKTRKKHKWRIDKFSLVISVIVGVGEGLIAATFIAATWPFLIALLAVGLPAAVCNYILLRNDSYSVMNEIWKQITGNSTDSPRKKTMKIFSSIFSGAAGLSYGFLSFGSALVTLGHLFFGLSVAAALATPPIGLIVLAAVVAAATAIALATLYDHMIRRWIDDGLTDKLKNLRDDFIDFFKPENGKWSELTFKPKCAHVARKTLDAVIHTVFFAAALGVAILVTIATTVLFKHKATDIFYHTFRLAHTAAEKVSMGITVGLGALVNTLFYIRSATYMVVSVAKSVASAIIHPVETAGKIKKAYDEFDKQNIYKKVERVVSAFKRLFLFATVVDNSFIGQGRGIGGAPVAYNAVTAVTDNLTTLNISQQVAVIAGTVAADLGSGGANFRAAAGATATVAVVSVEKPAAEKHSTVEKNDGRETPKTVPAFVTQNARLPRSYSASLFAAKKDTEEKKLRRTYSSESFFKKPVNDVVDNKAAKDTNGFTTLKK